MSRSPLLKSLLLAFVAVVAALAVAEVVGRLLTVPDERGYGALMGILLPPYRIVIPSQAEATDRSAPYDDLIVDGREITIGDMTGYQRFDPVLGYTNLENTRSVNGWWQSNNIGARETAPTPANPPPGRQRWLLMGESFAHGSRLPTEEGWAYVIEQQAPSLDVVNLAVDGYSMAQAYLRYEGLANSIGHHGVMLVFVPDVDLWRDVNTLRTLGSPWVVQSVMPRFVLDGDESLRLVPSPYSRADDLRRENADGLSGRLRDHLQQYDRFYFPYEHGAVPVIDRFITLKLIAAAYGQYARGALRRSFRKPGSEALRVSRAIFAALHRDATLHDRQFRLFVLPTENDLRRFRTEPDFSARWARLVQYVCQGSWECTDLAPALRSLEVIDTGADGTHFGPQANIRIAVAVRAALDDRQPADSLPNVPVDE